MKNTTLNPEQMREIADYAAKRSASAITQPLEVRNFVKEYVKTYMNAYDEISQINEQMKKEQSKKL